VLLATMTQVNMSHLSPSQASWYLISYPGGMEG